MNYLRFWKIAYLWSSRKVSVFSRGLISFDLAQIYGENRRYPFWSFLGLIFWVPNMLIEVFMCDVLLPARSRADFLLWIWDGSRFSALDWLFPLCLNIFSLPALTNFLDSIYFSSTCYSLRNIFKLFYFLARKMCWASRKAGPDLLPILTLSFFDMLLTANLGLKVQFSIISWF